MHGARILEHGAADYAARMVREEATAGVMVVGSHACGERATPALRNAGTDRVGFSLSGRVLSLSLSISRDIVVASIPYISKSRRKTRDGHRQSH